MPLRNASTTGNYADTELIFQPTIDVTFQVNNNPVRVQINVPQDQQGGFHGERWVDKGTVQPGIWHLGRDDFAQYGGTKCTGIRFVSDVVANSAVVNVNN